MESFRALLFSRVAAEHDSKQAVHSIVEVSRDRDFRARSHSSRLFHHEGRIEREERLLWDGCVWPTLNALVGDRKIECAKQGGQILAVHQTVERAPATERIIDEIDGPSAQGGVESASDKKQRVAHGFEVKPATRDMRQEFVF